MRINIEKFKKLLRKATCNYIIDNVKISFTQDEYKVGLRGDNVLVLIRDRNDIISGISSHDNINLLFSNVSKTIKPFVDLVLTDDNDEVEFKSMEEKVVLRSPSDQTIELYLCSDIVVNTYDDDDIKTDYDVVYQNDVHSFLEQYSLIKKVAGQYNKVYFTVKDSGIYIETTDKTGVVSNGMIMKIGECEYQDISMMLEYREFSNIMNIILDDPDAYYFELGYVKDVNGGCIKLHDADNNERYYQLTMRED